MMVAHFAIKAWNKIHEKPPATKEEVYRAMKAERERIRAQGARAMAQLDAASTPSNGCAIGIARFA